MWVSWNDPRKRSRKICNDSREKLQNLHRKKSQKDFFKWLDGNIINFTIHSGKKYWISLTIMEKYLEFWSEVEETHADFRHWIVFSSIILNSFPRMMLLFIWRLDAKDMQLYQLKTKDFAVILNRSLQHSKAASAISSFEAITYCLRTENKVNSTQKFWVKLTEKKKK